MALHIEPVSERARKLDLAAAAAALWRDIYDDVVGRLVFLGRGRDRDLVFNGFPFC